jgi:hypothetical protein
MLNTTPYVISSEQREGKSGGATRNLIQAISGKCKVYKISPRTSFEMTGVEGVLCYSPNILQPYNSPCIINHLDHLARHFMADDGAFTLPAFSNSTKCCYLVV